MYSARQVRITSAAAPASGHAGRRRRGLMSRKPGARGCPLLDVVDPSDGRRGRDGDGVAEAPPPNVGGRPGRGAALYCEYGDSDPEE